jgi:hypothetical protein
MIVLLKLTLTCVIKPDLQSLLFDTNQIALTSSIDQCGRQRRGGIQYFDCPFFGGSVPIDYVGHLT